MVNQKLTVDDEQKWQSDLVGWTKKAVIKLDAAQYPPGTVVEFTIKTPVDNDEEEG